MSNVRYTIIHQSHGGSHNDGRNDCRIPITDTPVWICGVSCVWVCVGICVLVRVCVMGWVCSPWTWTYDDECCPVIYYSPYHLPTFVFLYHLQFNFRWRSEVVLRWLHTVIDTVSVFICEFVCNIWVGETFGWFWSDKARVTLKTYMCVMDFIIWVSVWWKTKT